MSIHTKRTIILLMCNLRHFFELIKVNVSISSILFRSQTFPKIRIRSSIEWFMSLFSSFWGINGNPFLYFSTSLKVYLYLIMFDARPCQYCRLFTNSYRFSKLENYLSRATTPFYMNHINDDQPFNGLSCLNSLK